MIELRHAVVGSIVQYTNLGDRDGKYPPDIVPAVITSVDDLTVSLRCLYRTGTFDLASVAYTSELAGTWPAWGKWTNAGVLLSPSLLGEVIGGAGGGPG